MFIQSILQSTEDRRVLPESSSSQSVPMSLSSLAGSRFSFGLLISQTIVHVLHVGVGTAVRV